MKKTEKVVVALVIAIILIGMSIVSFATDDSDLFDIVDERNNNSVNNAVVNLSAVNNTSVNNTANTNTNTNTSINNIIGTVNTTRNNNTASSYNNTKTNTNTNSNLPYAGSSDSIAMIGVIAIFGVTALYAYKKVRDYNIK